MKAASFGSIARFLKRFHQNGPFGFPAILGYLQKIVSGLVLISPQTKKQNQSTMDVGGAKTVA